MFRSKKILNQIEGISKQVDHMENIWRDRYYQLRGDLDRLVETLGLVKEETHTVRYVKKGGPERP